VTPSYEHAGITLYSGDCLTVLPQLAAGSVQCCVTSPPYYGLRSYLAGEAAEIGTEETLSAYVARLVNVFRAVRRVLREDGTVWLNLGDSYAGAGGTPAPPGGVRPGNPEKNGGVSDRDGLGSVAGRKRKDLIGIPWLVAFALQADGWWLRSDIIWAKPAPMPESVTDRPTRSHEYLFLLARAERYFYDAAAIAERPWTPARGYPSWAERRALGEPLRRGDPAVSGHVNHGAGWGIGPAGRNKRDVWTVNSASFPDAHFATYPPALITPCILAGSRPGDLVLDPFSGAGTTMLVAKQLGRRGIGIDLNPAYNAMAARRLAQDVLPLEEPAS